MSKLFKNIKTGCIEEVNNPMVIEQCEKYTDVYEPVKGKPNNGADKELNYNELKKKAKEIGIDVPKGTKLPELKELIKVKENQE